MEECDLAALQAWMHVSAGCSLLHAGGRGEGHWTEGQQGEKKATTCLQGWRGRETAGTDKKDCNCQRCNYSLLPPRYLCSTWTASPERRAENYRLINGVQPLPLTTGTSYLGPLLGFSAPSLLLSSPFTRSHIISDFCHAAAH